MEDKDQSKTVHNDGVSLPEHDFAGLSEVIARAKPTLPGTENGFVPLASLDLAGHYAEVAKRLDAWENRLANSGQAADNILAYIKEEKKLLANRHESDVEQRARDLAEGYQGRLEEWREQHRGQLEQATQWRDEWKGRVVPVEARNEALIEERTRILAECYDTRIRELAAFHEEFKRELGSKIDDLKNREQELKVRLDAMEGEHRRDLMERAEWLQRQADILHDEKKADREAFNDMRRRIVKNEHPIDDVDKTPGRILAEKLNFSLIAGIVILFILAAAATIIIPCVITDDRAPKSASTKAEDNSLPKDAMVINFPETIAISIGHLEKKEGE